MSNFRILEVTNDNYSKYVEQIAKLEDKVLDKMNEEGQVGQFFTTGYDDILEYVLSNENSVLVAADDEDKVLAATYITEGQVPYTYNDITKYFKTGKEYADWVRAQYPSDEEYKKDILEAYELKLKAFEVAKSKLLEEYPEYGSIHEFLNHELNEEGNAFHEKSVLRDNINKYMSEYIIENGDPKLYERFYWTTGKDVSEVFSKDITYSEGMAEYEEVLNHMGVDSIEKPGIEDISKYYTANTGNSVEIDTYITDPESRASGLAKILVYDGIKKYIDRHFDNPEEREMFLCSTLHRLNVSSKYVSEFFGLKDSLFVNRRYGRTREVHITRIGRDEASAYLDHMYDKLAVLHGYNPENREISKETTIDILREELQTKMTEAKRLKTIRLNKDSNIKYKSYLVNRIIGIMKKTRKLKQEINKYEEEINDER